MKKFYTFIGILALTATVAFSQPASWQTVPDVNNVPPKRVYTVLTIEDFDYLASGAFDVFWDTVPYIDTLTHYVMNTDDNGNPTTRTPDSPKDLTAYMKAAWDNDYLYIAFKVTDDYIAEASDTIQDAFEIMYATYPDYWPAVYDTATTDAGKSAAFARWDTTGSRKTGGWTLQNSPQVVYDDYRPTWDFENWGPSATPWVVGWGSSADAFNFDAVYEKVNDTLYNYLVVIPWADAMENFVPTGDTAISIELKLVDKDPSKMPIQNTWNSDNNDSYWATYFSGRFELSSVATAKRDIFNDKAENITLYPNPAKNIVYLKNAGDVEKVDISNIIGQKVKSFVNVKQALDVSDLKNGMYFVTLHLKGDKVCVKHLIIQ